MQRLSVKFSRGEEIKFISHLDMMRMWERAFRRARIKLAYSEGFSPHPRLALAAPLALGVTSEAELMDVYVTNWVSPRWFTGAISQQLPTGVKLLGVLPVAPTLPSLQSQTHFAEYRVRVKTDRGQEDIEAAIEKLLSAETIPWHHERDTGTRSYDLRALVDDVWLADYQSPYGMLGMKLLCSNHGSGRPEQVALALGFTGHPEAILRTKLILET